VRAGAVAHGAALDRDRDRDLDLDLELDRI
jgi:hypothetical protein